MAKRVFVKRAQLAGSLTYRSWEKYAEGDSVTGKVVGFFEDSYKKTGIKMEVFETSFEDGTGSNLEGKILAINSCGALVEAIATLQEKFEENPKEEIIIRVEYTGKTKVQKGTYAGKDCHTAIMDLLGDSGEVQESFSAEDDDL